MRGRLCWASMAAPAKLLEWSDQIRHKETFIVLLELVALAAVYSSPVAQFLRGRDVLHFADNQSANRGAVKGRSSAPDLNKVIGELHPTWAELDVRPWVEYVRSRLTSRTYPHGAAETQSVAPWGRTLIAPASPSRPRSRVGCRIKSGMVITSETRVRAALIAPAGAVGGPGPPRPP